MEKGKERGNGLQEKREERNGTAALGKSGSPSCDSWFLFLVLVEGKPSDFLFPYFFFFSISGNGANAKLQIQHLLLENLKIIIEIMYIMTFIL